MRGRIAATAGVLVAFVTVGTSTADGRELKRCSPPRAGALPALTKPERVGLDGRQVQRAIDFASSRARSSVKVWRNNCLVGQSRVDPLTERLPMQEWSSTKSVVSLVTGIAVGAGELGLDDPIGKHLPSGTGWGDAAHRAITVRQLLTETAGLKQSIISEAGTVGNDPHVARQALALPLIHEPGSTFEYTQRVPDLLAFVVAQAVGEDFQAYAQRKLFAPIGIERDRWFWLRDRSGNTYGYANLFMQPRDFTRVGLLLTGKGRWGHKQVIPRSYVRAMRASSPQNPCYGFLVWREGSPCVSPSITSRRTVRGPILAPLPLDTYATVGAFQQNNFAIPSLGMTITWNGQFGDISSDPQTVLSANPHSELYWEFSRKLMRAVRVGRVPTDPGPYVDDPVNDVDVDQFADPAILLGGLGVGPYAPEGCTVLACGGNDLTAGPRQELIDIVRGAGGITG